jgi:hypothetical protein
MLEKHGNMKILPNTQRLGKLTFDSNQVKKSKTNPNVLIAKASDGKDYGVVRKSDGSYDYAGSSRNATFGDRMATASANPNIANRILDTAGLLMSEPQRMMTRALSDNKYNSPSEFIQDSKLPQGLKNTVGLASDMIADPSNLVGIGAGAKAAKLAIMLPAIPGLNKLFKSSKAATNVLSSTRNLEDLKEATNFAKKYGYELPKNLDRIAQSDMLTDRTVRGLMNRHNTFVRGVSTNWEEIGKKNPEILKQLESKGYNLSTPEGTKAAAEYMATHIPGETGYGRHGLFDDIFNQGLDGLYTSNSIPTAEGYTYGKGFIVKGKKPTDFSSTNRKDWITKNNPKYHDESIDINTYYKIGNEDITSLIGKNNSSTRYNLLKSAENNPEKLNDAKKEIIKEFEDYLARATLNNFNPNYGFKIDKDTTIKNIEKIKNMDFSNIKIDKDNFLEKGNILKQYYGRSNTDKYSHYAHIGKPGEKILELIKSLEINSDNYMNKSRGHSGDYTKKLSAMSKGGKLNNNSQKQLLPLLNKF